jgi:hypothetical protein
MPVSRTADWLARLNAGFLRLRRLSPAEEERNRVNPRQADNGENDSADDLVGPSEYAGNQIISEKADETPVDCAYNN